MFKTPVSTIRDVAELTEASPNLIARILGEMRGPGELEKIVGRIEMHENRLDSFEEKLQQVAGQPSQQEAQTKPTLNFEEKMVLNYVNNVISEINVRQVESDQRFMRLVLIGVVLIIFVVLALRLFFPMDLGLK